MQVKLEEIMTDNDPLRIFLSQVKSATLLDLERNHDINLLFKNLVEEVGEFAKALTIEQGLKKKPLDESSMHEAVDVIICAFAIFYASGGTDEELTSYGTKKLCKWNDRLKDESVKRNDL